MEGCFKARKNNYAHIVEKLLGKRAGNFLNFIFILTTYLLISMYFITASGIVIPILMTFGLLSED